MPTYDYSCPDCSHKFQRFHSMTADPIKDCPECEENNVRRLIGAGAGLIFKGSGFYITDYRSKSYTDAKEKDGSAPSPSTDSTSAKPSSTNAPAASTSSSESSSSGTSSSGSASSAS